MLKPEFVRRVHEWTDRLVAATVEPGPAMLIGTIVDEGGQNLQCDAARRRRPGASARTLKHELPNYGTFDEKRIFAPGPLPEPIEFQGREARRPDLRGYLARAGLRAISPMPARSCCSSPTAVRTSSTRTTSAIGWCVRGRCRLGCRSPISTASAARTSWCSTARRSSCTRDGERVVQMCDWEEALLVTDWERSGGRLALRDAATRTRSIRSQATSTRR